MILFTTPFDLENVQISSEKLIYIIYMSELALIEKANEGNFLGNYAKWAIHTLFIHYITKCRH